jgi:uncharacterized protein YqjF (DUF2071 family)
MAWLDLAFLHWQADPAVVAAKLPRGVTVDTWGGAAWLGVVPFTMADVRPRGTPVRQTFLELNLRTYVTVDGVPGVWFFSLDAASRSAVRVGRGALFLPYFDADLQRERRGDWTHDVGRRTHAGAPRGEYEGAFRPSGPPFSAEPGSLEHWLTERYFLYSVDPWGGVWRGRVDHAPWRLRPAEARVERCTLGDAFGLPLVGAPLAHCTDGVTVRAWPIVRAGRVPR